MGLILMLAVAAVDDTLRKTSRSTTYNNDANSAPSDLQYSTNQYKPFMAIPSNE